jgi:hypothetical protein
MSVSSHHDESSSIQQTCARMLYVVPFALSVIAMFGVAYVSLPGKTAAVETFPVSVHHAADGRMLTR